MFPPVLSSAQMRAVDRDAAARTGLPSLILMENAGRGVAEIVARRRPTPAADAGGVGRPWVVCVACGPGNNGGDGFVVARHLAAGMSGHAPAAAHASLSGPADAGTPGVEIRVLLAAPDAKITGDAATMRRALDGLAGVSVADMSGASTSDDWRDALGGADVVVDALLGTGLRDDVAGVYAAAIAGINAAGAFTVAVDVPSGLDADSGRPRGGAVRADVTVTMGARKLGLVLDAEAGVGDLEVVGLGVPIAPPPPAAKLGAPAFWIDEAGVRALLPRRRAAAYKGDGGHLIVVAGSAGKTGAALLTARAALRAGAGLVTVASTAAGQGALDAKVVEAMTARFSDGDDADAGSFAAIAALLGAPHARALAIGPGIPTGPGMRALVTRLVREAAVPAVVDADGLNLLGAHAAESLAAAPAPRVVTPHPGEMARLIGQTTADVQADRVGVARAFAARSRAVVVLKGARTLVVAPDDGAVFVNPAAEPALGTAGSGDVLTGVIAALLAQGMAPVAAAVAGVFLHGQAGARAARLHGAPGTIAGDLPRVDRGGPRGVVDAGSFVVVNAAVACVAIGPRATVAHGAIGGGPCADACADACT